MTMILLIVFMTIFIHGFAEDSQEFSDEKTDIAMNSPVQEYLRTLFPEDPA